MRFLKLVFFIIIFLIWIETYFPLACLFDYFSELIIESIFIMHHRK